jgi:hypothetical protein
MPGATPQADNAAANTTAIGARILHSVSFSLKDANIDPPPDFLLAVQHSI